MTSNRQCHIFHSVLIWISLFICVTSREACHDFYRGQQWRAARCPAYCCGSPRYTYCCETCSESVYTQTCDKSRDIQVPSYSNEDMFIACLCGASGAGVLLIFCIATVIMKQCSKRRRARARAARSGSVVGLRRDSRRHLATACRTELVSVLPQGIPPGEKCKFTPPPPPAYTTPRPPASPTSYTPPPPYDSRTNLHEFSSIIFTLQQLENTLNHPPRDRIDSYLDSEHSGATQPEYDPPSYETSIRNIPP